MNRQPTSNVHRYSHMSTAVIRSDFPFPHVTGVHASQWMTIVLVRSFISIINFKAKQALILCPKD